MKLLISFYSQVKKRKIVEEEKITEWDLKNNPGVVLDPTLLEVLIEKGYTLQIGFVIVKNEMTPMQFVANVTPENYGPIDGSKGDFRSLKLNMKHET